MAKVKVFLEGILFFGLMFFMLVSTGYIETHYSREMEVYDKEGNILILEDNQGNLWEYETENNDYRLGQKYKVKMFNNYTDNTIYDDEIIRIEKVR